MMTSPDVQRQAKVAAGFSTAELARIRTDTPAHGQYAHFSHGSASLPPRPVFEALDQWLEAEKTLGTHRATDRFADALNSVKSSVGQLINARPYQIALLDSASHAWSAAMSAALARHQPVHVITSPDEYGANGLYLLTAKQRGRLTFSVLPGRCSGEPLLAQLDRALAQVPPAFLPVVSLSAVPTAHGVATDLAGVADFVRGYKGLFFLDASHAVGQYPVDVSLIDCDVLVFPSRKWLRGPKGVGVLYVSDRALQQLGVPDSVDVAGALWCGEARFKPQPDAGRFEGFEFNPGLHLALKAACDYALGLGLENIQHENLRVRQRVASVLLDCLGWMPLEEVQDDATALMTYALPTAAMQGDSFVQQVWAAGVNLSIVGLQQAPWAFEAIPVQRLLRLTPHYLTDEAEIERLAGAFEAARQTGPPAS